MVVVDRYCKLKQAVAFSRQGPKSMVYSVGCEGVGRSLVKIDGDGGGGEEEGRLGDFGKEG